MLFSIYIAQQIYWFVSRLLFVSCLLAFGGCTELPKPVRVDGATNCKGKSTPLDRLSGISPVKLVFVDKDGRGVRLDETERKMDWLKSVKIAKTPAPSVYALETNQKVEGVAISVQKEVVDSAVSHVHPLYTLAYQNLLNRAERDEKDKSKIYVNRLLSFSFDEGERGLAQDSTKQRRKAIVSFVEETLLGPDYFSAMLLPFPLVARGSYFFAGIMSNGYIQAENDPIRYHYRSKDRFEMSKLKKTILEMKFDLSEKERPNFLGWIGSDGTSIFMRRSTSGEIGVVSMLPAIVMLATDIDSSIVAGQPDAFVDVESSLISFGADKAIPFFAVLHPKPSDVTRAMWDTYTNQLCQLSKLNGGVSWGNVFQLRANQLDAKDIKKRLDFAYHALKGHTTLDFKYNISGDSLRQGTRYVLEFYLSLEDEENGTQRTSSIPVRMEFQP
ncbi:MAG: hypothetical protein CL920_27085 [Deltaproteobacteria bacterium]|nr:hypothetical protein [Deltaproteobacteria bacterium]MBU52375.1 hypothetical protein [Deltaproteobacteria bacterium]|tara:strand:+ start:2888 stop:4216 length:1329 start_codon:yes stop_codon:yes gene_type:complete